MTVLDELMQPLAPSVCAVSPLPASRTRRWPSVSKSRLRGLDKPVASSVYFHPVAAESLYLVVAVTPGHDEGMGVVWRGEMLSLAVAAQLAGGHQSGLSQVSKFRGVIPVPTRAAAAVMVGASQRILVFFSYFLSVLVREKRGESRISNSKGEAALNRTVECRARQCL